MPTAGGHDLLPPAGLTALLTGIGAAIDAKSGRFTTPYTAVVVTGPIR